MNNDPHDYSLEDDGVDEDMMFEFEEELTARLSLREGVASSSSSSSFVGDSRTRSPFQTFTDQHAALSPPRPQNPVAVVLESANDADDTAFASLSASPFAFGSSTSSAMRMGSAGLTSSQDKPPSFDFNGRRKRKYFDDSCCVTPRVRPLAKRAKSFSCVGDVLLPDCGFKSISSTSFVPCVVEPKPTTTTTTTTTTLAAAKTSLQQPVFSSTRSKSIQIPHRVGASHAHQRSSSGPARATSVHGAKTVEAPAASSDPLTHRASSSWNASVEYFCRRSLDISSPLRTRFRDLVVGSVGRAGGLKSP